MTNFEKITESPEDLAEKLVHSSEDEWYGKQYMAIVGDDIREWFRTRDQAVAATLEWLKKEVER